MLRMYVYFIFGEIPIIDACACVCVFMWINIIDLYSNCEYMDDL